MRHAGAGSAERVGVQGNGEGTVLKIGLDVHATFFVAVVQEDHGTPGPPRRFAPPEFATNRSTSRPCALAITTTGRPQESPPATSWSTGRNGQRRTATAVRSACAAYTRLPRPRFSMGSRPATGSSPRRTRPQ